MTTSYASETKITPTEYNQTPINWILILCTLFTSHSILVHTQTFSRSYNIFFISNRLNVNVYTSSHQKSYSTIFLLPFLIIVVVFFLLHPACVRCVGRAHNDMHQYCFFFHFIPFRCCCCGCCYCLFCFTIMIIFQTIKMESTLGLPQNGVL